MTRSASPGVAAYRVGRREVPPEGWAELAAFMEEHGGKLAEAAEELGKET